MLESAKGKISNHNPLRLLYHKLKAMAAAVYYRFPSDQMTIIGITGTNGKTTTSHLVTDILMEAGHKVGMITTADFRIVDQVIPNRYKMTSLNPFVTQRMLRDMADRGCSHAVVEVTSHAMDQNRLWGVNMDVAVFTNISHDHLDYHGTKKEYIRSKGKLFASLNYSKRKPNVPKIAIINGDDKEGKYFEQFVADRTYIYGLSKGSFQGMSPVYRSDGTYFIYKVPNDQADIDLPLPGKFNVENALAAATVGAALEINLKIIKKALSKATPVPGRLERIDEGQKYTTVVDYAHAPDSLEQLLQMFRDLTEKRLIVVFGATGDRDKTKRPDMGKIVDKYADLILLTDDDPYTEDRIEIIEGISRGIKRAEGDRFWKIPDRRQAIRVALSLAKEGDTVIVAGKGCEEFQVVGNKKIPSDDREIVRNYLSRKVEIEIGPGKSKTGNPYLAS
jgi:UDP-N-acetylmuramoyl-L-alanyl-D-glutamate--2,6-diaminopimelate ligase